MLLNYSVDNGINHTNDTKWVVDFMGCEVKHLKTEEFHDTFKDDQLINFISKELQISVGNIQQDIPCTK